MAEITSLGAQVATGATWMVLQRLAIRTIGLVSTIVLARLLAPDDFGILALATGLFAVLDALFELGFELALIQNQADGQARYNTAWTLSVIRGLVVASALCLGAEPIAQFYEDPRLEGVMFCLAVVAVLGGVQNIGVVEFRKALHFDREFRLLVISKIAAFTVTMTIAWLWRDYTALIAGIVAGKAVSTILSYVMHPYRPSFSLQGARSFWNFSLWLFFNNIAMIIKSRLDTFVVGKVAGAESLGFYTVGFEISNLTTTELVAPISRVLFPGFSRIAGDRPRLAQAFLDSLGLIVLLAAPLSCGIAITAQHIVMLFLGSKWLAIVPLVQILTLYGLLNLTSANSGSLYYALGRTDLVFWRNLPSIIVLVPALIIGTQRYGAEGAAWSLVLSAAVNFVVLFVMIHRELSVGVRAILGAIWRPLFASGIMLAVLTALTQQWIFPAGVLGILGQFAAIVFIGGVVYAASICSIWLLTGRPWGAEARVLQMVSSVLGRWKRPSAA